MESRLGRGPSAHSPEHLLFSLQRRCWPPSPASQGQDNPTQRASEDHHSGTQPGQPGGQTLLPKAPPPTPVARSPRSPRSPRVPDGPHVQARQPSGRAGRGLGRPAGPGGRLPAGACPRRGAHGLAARLAQLAAGARGGQPALGALSTRHPAGCAPRAHVPAALHARCFAALADARQSAPSRLPFCPCANPDSALPTARASIRGSILHTQATGFPPRRGRNHLSRKQG